MKKALLAFALCFLVWNLAAMAALAATSTASFSVTVTVQSTCLVSASAAAFGPNAATELAKAVSHVSVACTQPTPYNVHFSAGKTANPPIPAAPPESVAGASADAIIISIIY